jgi:hypothetical protein
MLRGVRHDEALEGLFRGAGVGCAVDVVFLRTRRCRGAHQRWHVLRHQLLRSLVLRPNLSTAGDHQTTDDHQSTGKTSGHAPAAGSAASATAKATAPDAALNSLITESQFCIGQAPEQFTPIVNCPAIGIERSARSLALRGALLPCGFALLGSRVATGASRRRRGSLAFLHGQIAVVIGIEAIELLLASINEFLLTDAPILIRIESHARRRGLLLALIASPAHAPATAGIAAIHITVAVAIQSREALLTGCHELPV